MKDRQEGNDSQLMRAFEESFQSKSFLPLLKEELKCKIQCRRLSKGEEEMKVQFEEQKDYQLTDEEIIKRQRRLFQNRRSAVKRKLKEKLYEEELLARIRRLETENYKKEEEKRSLAHQKDVLCFAILNHNCRLDTTFRPFSGKFVSLLK